MLSEAEQMLGVSSGTLTHWLKSNKFYTRRVGTRRFVNVRILEAYEKSVNPLGVRRVDEPPYGYLTIAEAVEKTGIGDSTIRDAIAKGKLELVRKAITQYIEPYSLQKFEYEFKNYPLPGWIDFARLFRDRGGYDSTPTQFFKRNGYEIRKYRRRSDHLIRNHVLEKDYQEFLEYYERNKNDQTRNTLSKNQAVASKKS